MNITQEIKLNCIFTSDKNGKLKKNITLKTRVNGIFTFDKTGNDQTTSIC